MKSGNVQIAITNIPPFWIWSGPGPIPKCDGLLCSIVQSTIHALQRMNLSVVTVLNTERSLGSELSPGNWTGVIGALSRKEADVFGGYYGIVPGVNDVVEMSTAFGSDEIGILSGPPMDVHRKTPSLFSAVSPFIWTLLGSSWLLVSCLYLFMSKVEANIFRRKDHNGFIGTLLTLYGLLFQRGFENLPDTVCRRILVSGWLFLVLIFTVELSTALSSKLAVEDAPERIDKLTDVLKYPHLRLYVPKGATAEKTIRSSTDSKYRAVWKQVQKHGTADLKLPQINLQVVDQVSEGVAAIVSTTQTHINYLVGVSCRRRVKPFYMAKETVGRIPLIVPFRKNIHSRISEALNQMLTQYGAMGFQQKSFGEIGEPATPCFHNRGPQMSFKSTSLLDFVGAFQFLAIGLTICSTAFLLEIAVFKITSHLN